MDIVFPGISTAAALAAVSLIGYMFGRMRRSETTPAASRQNCELQRAKAIVNELEAIAGDLRKGLASHHSSIVRFRNRISEISGEEQHSAWIQLCEETEKVMRPTMKLALQVSEAYDGIRQQSHKLLSFSETRTDPLTGVFNRRGLDESLHQLFELYSRYQRPFSIGIFDIDEFKKINEQHGHMHGDRQLKKVARVIHESARATDIVTRYSGEEFVVVMPHSDLDSAAMYGERLREAVEKKSGLTISGGIAQVLDGDDQKSLIARADESLYGAKASGRNRVFYHNGLTVEPYSEPLEAVASQ